MPRKFWNKVSLALLVLTGMALALMDASGAEPMRSFRQLGADAFQPGRIVVISKPGRDGESRQFHRIRGATIRKEYRSLGRIQVIELPRGADTLEFVETYQRSGLFDTVEPDFRFYPAAIPNDPFFVNQWALNNIGQSGGITDADIDAPEAWERFHSASNIIVAVIDSGVRETHEDLMANLWVNTAEIPGNGIDDDQNGYVDDIHGINAIVAPNLPTSGQPIDDLGHGTHVSGIIGAVGNNGIGVCGLAWQVRVMACKFLNPSSGSLSDLIDCIHYAQANGANVLNCSFTTSTYSDTLSNTLWSVRNDGIVVAAAAGNVGTDNDSFPIYPASFKIDNIVSVTATTALDGFSGYNYGATSVHLGAPGTSILSTYYRSDVDYSYQSGTSMACPHVAGALALLRARYPQFTPQQLIARLLATVDPLPSLAGRCTTGGRLNLDRALGPREYSLGSVPFAWVPTNGMSRIVLDNDGVTSALPLPFPFIYYGQSFSEAYVAANGIVGFQGASLNQSFDTDLPTASNPNGSLYVYWDDLNPASGGEIWQGMTGLEPNRKFVISWVNVPHTLTTGGPTLFTFQAVLHETGEITFQYGDVQNGRSTLISGKSASVGIEDLLGLTAVRYAYHGSPSLLTNRQALLFSQAGNPRVGPSLKLGSLSGGQVTIDAFSQPGQRLVWSASSDAQNWVPVETNTVPASGVLQSTRPLDGGNRFFRAALDPAF